MFNNLKIKEMKKIIIATVTLIVTTSFCFAQKTLNYDGISFDQSGWKSLQTARKTTGKDAGTATISGTRNIPYVGIFIIQITKAKSDDTPLHTYTENLQEETVRNVTDAQNNGTSKLKVEPKSTIEDTVINGIKAKYFDLKYKQGIGSSFQRTFCLEKDGYMITIITTSGTWDVNTHNRHFEKILTTFSFNPE